MRSRPPAFSATVKYAKNNGGRNIELLTLVRPGNTSGMVVYGRQIRREQGDSVLSTCDLIMATSISKIHREQQEKVRHVHYNTRRDPKRVTQQATLDYNMKRLFKALRVKSEANQLFDLIISLIEKQDLTAIRRVADDSYIAGDATITIKYFDPEAFEEMQISFGYAIGKGVTVVLRNYVEHLIVINHEVLEAYHTIEFPIRTDTFLLRDYREKLDNLALEIIAAVGTLSDD